MITNPLVSVIIPTYKRSDYLMRAIDSVLNQTYKNIEIIVVDDNDNNSESRKLTHQKLEGLINDKKIIYLKHESNKGLSAARNTGLLNAKGDYISFLDDDDEFHPQKTEVQLKIFKNSDSNVGLVYSAFLRIDVETRTETIVYPKYKGNVRSILGLNHIGPPSMVMCSREAVDKIGGFDVAFRSREDIEFYYRLSEFFTVDYTDEVLMSYYVHSNAMSRIQSDKLFFLEKFIEKYFENLKNPTKRWSEIQERLGELHAINGNAIKAWKAFLLSYKYNPSRLAILGKLVLSFLGKKYYMKYRNVR
ncbi:glycosyltransferase family 2 protein [Flavobacterium silvisoli]|uniref:Glycosyltransferase family 2 protein n=1 Tax=Flavobacterium silvisoli TaxID=2529433 RepID=A0A4Q9YS20_9FLAO|nr:glycosyltransferase family 2 protein [Flavobacterium silvisoli]TBX66359.1 glycosyltransferase family 2 protein [Flavobacterium silvisoli]